MQRTRGRLRCILWSGVTRADDRKIKERREYRVHAKTQGAQRNTEADFEFLRVLGDFA